MVYLLVRGGPVATRAKKTVYYCRLVLRRGRGSQGPQLPGGEPAQINVREHNVRRL